MCPYQLGLTSNCKSTWNDHFDNAVKKKNKRLYFLSQLKRAKVKSKELALFYIRVLDLLLIMLYLHFSTHYRSK